MARSMSRRNVPTAMCSRDLFRMEPVMTVG